jgi:diaminohydroxyphosphoribosylaminopyrimidine deaminase/5-amino-6-(5-phosphoribosylamino)uracil reductase
MLENDVQYMRRALDLAELGSSTVSPNPLVGAVLVKNGKIIGEGHHQIRGEGHAEVNAIESASEDVAGSTLYCTLEPCCHTKKVTPPCTDLIVVSRIRRVVIAAQDPNPLVSGQGVEILRSHGIDVNLSVLEEEAKKQNKIFFKNMLKKQPFVHIKVASTLDGRIATSEGDSRWITSEFARQEVHALRLKYDAVMIGKNTLRQDNPSLNARENDKVLKENHKIVVGDLEEKDLDLNIFKSKKPVINIFNKKELKHPNLKSIKKSSTWSETFKDLYKENICSILVEGGSVLISSLIEEENYDEATFYFSTKVIGNGPSLFKNEKNKLMSEAKELNGTWRILRSQEAVLEVLK